MNRVTFLMGSVLIFITLWVLSASAGSEVLVMSDRLTVKVHNASLKEVLEEIEYQGGFPVVVVNDTDLREFSISEQLVDVALEEGIHRLLLHWNYALTKDASSGQVKSLFIASKREKVSIVTESPLPTENVTTEEVNDEIDLQTGEKIVLAPEIPPWELNEYQEDSLQQEEEIQQE